MAQWPHERSLVKNLKDKPFALIGVHLNNSGDDASVVRKVMAKEQLNWRSFVDKGAIADKWKPAGTPSFYILDAKGVIRHKWAGAPSAKAIDMALENVIHDAEQEAKLLSK
jgi:hypothetical protein